MVIDFYRDNLSDLLLKLFGGDRNPSKVVDTPLEFGLIGFEESQTGIDAIVNVDGWKMSIRSQIALMSFILQSIEEDFGGVAACAI